MKKVLHKAGILGMVLAMCGLLAVILAYVAAVPQLLASDYTIRIGASMTSVNRSVETLSKTPESEVFTNYDTSLAHKSDQLKQVQMTIDNTDRKLDAFSGEISNLLGVMFARYVNAQYQRAVVVQSKMERSVMESRDVLRDYERLVIYTQTITKAQQTFEDQMAVINHVDNFDALAGRGAEIHEGADRLRVAKHTLQEQQPAYDFKKPHETMVRCLTLGIEGLDGLAAGLTSAIDAEIYTGVTTIEAAEKCYDPTLKDALFETLENTPVLTEVINLPDKFSSFKA